MSKSYERRKRRKRNDLTPTSLEEINASSSNPSSICISYKNFRNNGGSNNDDDNVPPTHFDENQENLVIHSKL